MNMYEMQVSTKTWMKFFISFEKKFPMKNLDYSKEFNIYKGKNHYIFWKNIG